MKQRNVKGISVIELIGVLAVISVLALFVLPKVFGWISVTTPLIITVVVEAVILLIIHGILAEFTDLDLSDAGEILYLIGCAGVLVATVIFAPKFLPNLLGKIPAILPNGSASFEISEIPIEAEIGVEAGIGVGNDILSPEDNNIGIGNHDNTTINNYYVTADGQEISGALLFNKVETKLKYSSDNGETWKDRVSNLNIGSSYYMTVSMKVSQSVKTDTEQIIHADIVFPDTNTNQISVEEAQGLKDWEGQLNEENHTITYPVEIISGVDPAEFSVTFLLTPSTNGTFPVMVTYDDQINENWDKTVNLKYGTN